MAFSEKYQRFAWLLLLVPIYLFLFLKLGSTHIRPWDESWYSVHAIEMWQNGEWFFTRFDGVSDVYASKPPFQNWMQKAFIELIGVNELAVRLPSAISASLTVLVVYQVVKVNSSIGWGVASALILMTSIGFVNFHTARSADADALLTLGLMAQSVVFYRFIQTKRLSSMILLGLAIGLTFWSKSMASLLFIPGFIFYFLLSERRLFFQLLKSWQLYAGMILALALIFTYILIRISVQPEYIEFFMNSNVGRYASSVGHDQPIGFYLNNLFGERFTWWFPLSMLGMVFSFFERKAWNGLVLMASILAISYMLFISFSKSKLGWYDMPFYPLAAICTSYGIHCIVKSLSSLKLQLVAILILFIFPISNMFSRTQANAISIEEMNAESQEIYLNRAFRSMKDMDQTIVIHDHFKGPLVFYKHKFAAVNQSLTLINHTSNLKPNDKILIKGEHHLGEVHQTFNVDTIGNYKKAYHLQLISKKNENQSINHE